MKKLLLILALLLCFTSCIVESITGYDYEALNENGKRVRVRFVDYGSRFIDNPYSVGDTVQIGSDGYIRKDSEIATETVVILKALEADTY